MYQQILVRGGIGNQMYQYAFLLFMRNHGHDIKLNTSMYNITKMHNGYELNRVFGINELVKSYKGPALTLLRSLIKYGLLVKNENFEHIFDVISCKKPIFDGYWQSYKYFDSISQDVRLAFQFKDIDERCKSLSREMLSRNSVSLHIRRGDYLTVNGYSGICTEQYYFKAIQYIQQHVNNPHFFVFSDDKEWCSSHLDKWNINYQLVNFNEGPNSYQDMFLMSKCRHNIIANSSFSWWGAWLNDNTDKIIIAPKQWYQKDTSYYNSIRIPKQWIRL